MNISVKNLYVNTGAERVCRPKLWNTLPLAIRSVNTVNDFKGKLKTYLFSKAFLLKSE